MSDFEKLDLNFPLSEEYSRQQCDLTEAYFAANHAMLKDTCDEVKKEELRSAKGYKAHWCNVSF